MQTPESPFHARPALLHSVSVVYDRGEAPGYDVAYDSWLAHPAINPTTAKAVTSAPLTRPLKLLPSHAHRASRLGRIF